MGPGGIGKSSLALAALHHESVLSKFGSHRYFISCEAASSHTQLLAVVALYFGLAEEQKLDKAIIQCLSSIQGPALLVLDNFETPWESTEYQSLVEDFLSLLADIPNLHLVVCKIVLCLVFKLKHLFSDHCKRYRETKESSMDTPISKTSSALE